MSQNTDNNSLNDQNALDEEERERELHRHDEPPSKIMRALGALPALFVSALIIWSYTIYVFVFQFSNLRDDNNLRKIGGAVSLVIFHIFFIPFIISFIRTVFSDPGKVPQQFSDIDNARELVYEIKWNGREVRKCTVCNIVKPDRTHHCRTCGRCSLKMDHHCPWVSNCVGWGNYKYFVLFLTYTVIICMVVSLSMLDWVIENAFYEKAGGPRNILQFLLFIIATVFGLGLLMFTLTHYRMIFVNLTTLESLNKRRFRRKRNSSAAHLDETSIEKTFRNPYDIGSKRNFEQVFGTNKLLWFFPLFTSTGDGFHFPTRDTIPKEEDDHLLPRV
mmetsp:Transcript_14050/g.19544  ORF Transcript_14050/g.19544 Transcript_14050/m.19544 type:complete len:332 (+) Transcript_14050:20-1015(+)